MFLNMFLRFWLVGLHFLCHSEEQSDEESRVHSLCIREILRYALNDNGKIIVSLHRLKRKLWFQ